jgi:hypothetical protein
MESKRSESYKRVAVRVTDDKGKTPQTLEKGVDYRVELHVGERPLVFALQLM